MATKCQVNKFLQKLAWQLATEWIWHDADTDPSWKNNLKAPSNGQVCGRPTCWNAITSGPAASAWQDKTCQEHVELRHSFGDCSSGRIWAVQYESRSAKTWRSHGELSWDQNQIISTYQIHLRYKAPSKLHPKKQQHRRFHHILATEPPNMWGEAVGHPPLAESGMRDWKPAGSHLSRSENTGLMWVMPCGLGNGRVFFWNKREGPAWYIYNVKYSLYQG